MKCDVIIKTINKIRTNIAGDGFVSGRVFQFPLSV